MSVWEYKPEINEPDWGFSIAYFLLVMDNGTHHMVSPGVRFQYEGNVQYVYKVFANGRISRLPPSSSG